MRLISMLAVLFTAYAALAQEIDYPYVHDLKGPVQECSEKKFAANFSADGIKIGSYQYDRNIGVRLFDRNGRLVEFREHAEDSSGRYEKTMLTYNASGCLTEIKEYMKQGALESNSVCKCDEEGRVTAIAEYYFLYEDKPISKTTYRYDRKGHITEIHEKYGTPKRVAGKLTDTYQEDRYKHRYNEYDNNGFLVKWTLKREGIDGELVNLLSGNAEVKNDAQGRPVAEYGVNDEAAKAGTQKKLQKEMAYNEKGFLSSDIRYSSSLGTQITCYEYTYDAQGNWITKTEMRTSDRSCKNGVPQSIIVREIKYY